jgi:hypothetical protein
VVRHLACIILAIIVVLAASCNTSRQSAAGFRLPSSGDAERGRVAFIELKCYQCHEVPGLTLPSREATSTRPVPLGGETDRIVTDGYLVTAIINPSWAIARFPAAKPIGDRGKSRMPEHSDNITVRQLTDIVAFLQSRYVVREPLPNPAYN